METLRTGDFAYFDSFIGLITCKVLSITGKSGLCSTAQRCKVKITSFGKAWKHGEEIECFAIHVIPRQSVKFNKYGNSRISPYLVSVD